MAHISSKTDSEIRDTEKEMIIYPRVPPFIFTMLMSLCHLPEKESIWSLWIFFEELRKMLL